MLNACGYGTVETVNATLVYGNYYHAYAWYMKAAVGYCCNDYNCFAGDCSAKCKFIKGKSVSFLAYIFLIKITITLNKSLSLYCRKSYHI